jgi:4-amino-4-deoxy-L-arabinose transferase-like glycosyltransferase
MVPFISLRARRSEAAQIDPACATVTDCRSTRPASAVCTPDAIGYEGGVNAPVLSPLQPADGQIRRGGLLAADYGPWQLALLLLAILAIRIVGLALSNAELYFDEAQYWAWAQQPDFGYFSKPPLLAWIIAASTALFGDSPFAVRLPSPLMHCATSFVIYAIAARLYEPRVGFWAALLYAIMPGTSISAILMSTDVPLLLFWSIALLALLHHVEKPSLGAGLTIGLAIGLGLNAKYAMIYVLLCYAVHAVIAPQARASLRHPGSWAGLGLAVLLIAPNLWWNAAHQFATFEHTRENADWNGNFPNVLGLLAFIGMQIAIVSPVPAAAYGLAMFGRPASSALTQHRFLLAMSLPVFLLICVQALISKANGNWAAPGFVGAVVVAAAVMLALDWRRGMIFTLAFCGVALVGISFAGSFAGIIRTGPIGGELGKMVGWGDFAAKIRTIAEANRLKTVVFVGRGMTASMLYELRDSQLDIRSYVADGKAPADHFEMTRPWHPADGGPVLLVLPGAGPVPAAVAKGATLIEQFKTEIFVTKAFGWTASAWRID